MDEGKVQAFFHAPVVAIADVIATTRKRRLSLEGRVTQVCTSTHIDCYFNWFNKSVNIRMHSDVTKLKWIRSYAIKFRW